MQNDKITHAENKSFTNYSLAVIIYLVVLTCRLAILSLILRMGIF